LALGLAKKVNWIMTGLFILPLYLIIFILTICFFFAEVEGQEEEEEEEEEEKIMKRNRYG
jgi:phosphotransferase system  glucose/maltose/N-acetylglucosamine-specific IIC component